MKRHNLLFIALLASMFVFSGSALLSDAVAQEGADMQQMMESWQRTINPGADHERLEALVGQWTTTTKTFWAGPDGPAKESQGTATKKWVLDKRFVMQEFSGEFPMPGADGTIKMVPYEGIGMLGFDNYRKIYVHTWADSLSTALLRTTGTMPPGKNTLQLYGEMDEPMLGITGRTVRFETKIIDNDSHVFAIYDLAVNSDYKVIEIAYQRKSP